MNSATYSVRVVVELTSDRRNVNDAHTVELKWSSLGTIREVEAAFSQALTAVRGLPRDGLSNEKGNGIALAFNRGPSLGQDG
jgi:hypothetical protein